MGCGCRGGGRRSPVRTITPQATTRISPNRIRQAEATMREMSTKITGLSKEQRDAERKRRIQSIIKKKNLNQ